MSMEVLGSDLDFKTISDLDFGALNGPTSTRMEIIEVGPDLFAHYLLIC